MAFKFSTSQKIVLAIAIVGMALYLPTANFGYALDDELVIKTNEFVQNGFAGIADIFSHNFADGGKNFNDGLYRPLSVATFAIEVGLFGKHIPGVSHVLNALIYFLTIWILGLLLIRLKLENLALAIPLLLFALHPVHTEVVSNIKGRDDLFALLFGASFALYFLKGLKEGTVHFATSGAMLLLALFSKETAMTYFVAFPLLFLALPEIKLNKLLVKLIPFALLTFGFLAMRTWVINSMAGDVDPGLSAVLNNPIAATNNSIEALATAFKLQWMYLVKMIWPATLIHDYSYNQIPMVGFGSLLSLLGVLFFLGGMVAAFYFGIMKRKLWALALGFYLATLFVTSNILVHIGAMFAERFLYIPSFGLLLAIGLGISQILKNQKPILYGALALICVSSIYQTLTRSQDWKNNLSLFITDLPKGPESARINYNYATVMMVEAEKNNEPETGPTWSIAEKYYLKTLEIYPPYYDALNNLGAAYRKQKKYSEAEKYLEKLVSINPRYAKGKMNLGLVYEQSGKFKECIKIMEDYVAILANDPDAYYILGKAAGGLNDFVAAERYLLTATQLRPDNADFFAFYGLALAFQGKNQEAERALLNATSIDPTKTEGHKNLLLLYINTGRIQQALNHLKITLKHLPNNPYFLGMQQDLTNQLNQAQQPTDQTNTTE
ncbi:MAG: tetratricopeptide repeat protein [Bacteroidetes bacterium]|nr:tetratricopeptide repeat protein [Bacteroidota bacterium]